MVPHLSLSSLPGNWGGNCGCGRGEQGAERHAWLHTARPASSQRPGPALTLPGVPEGDASGAGRLVPSQDTHWYSSVRLAAGNWLAFHVTCTVSKLKLTM